MGYTIGATRGTRISHLPGTLPFLNGAHAAQSLLFSIVFCWQLRFYLSILPLAIVLNLFEFEICCLIGVSVKITHRTDYTY